MLVRIIQIVRLLIILASRHRSLVFENLALRQQLALYHRTRPKPTVRWSDRPFCVGLRLAWPDWKSALVIVRPATVIAWRRRGFAWYWTRRSRPPDINVPLDVNKLGQGQDNQLSAATGAAATASTLPSDGALFQTASSTAKSVDICPSW